MTPIHHAPSLTRLRLTLAGESTVTTWGEFLSAYREQRAVARSVYDVVCGSVRSVVVDGMAIERWAR